VLGLGRQLMQWCRSLVVLVQVPKVPTEHTHFVSWNLTNLHNSALGKIHLVTIYRSYNRTCLILCRLLRVMWKPNAA
jgi:hypothetical protein